MKKKKNIVFAVFFEFDDNGFFIANFKCKVRAIKFANFLFDWLMGHVLPNEIDIRLIHSLPVKRYSVNTRSYYNFSFINDFEKTNGTQSIFVKKVDFRTFDYDLFFYERKMYVRGVDNEVWDELSELNQEILGGIILN